MAVPMQNRSVRDQAWLMSLFLAALFFTLTTSVSILHWANFQYRTFDLAYYVQALWQLVHGRFDVSVQGVPLLGNHVEPIVFLLAPLFLLVPHPMLFVVVQNLALASLAPVAYRIGKRLDFSNQTALLLAAAVLLTPAAGYIALHEFHPEALAAPFLLLMFEARLARSLRAHWIWLLAVLACKENMAGVIAAYCAVQFMNERKRRSPAELRAWYLWPLALAIAWFLLCTLLITPSLNSGNIEYGALYDRLGSSPRQMLLNIFTQPQLILHALRTSLSQGNIVWGLLLPFLCLPLLQPRWLLIALPILLQHLLSWRSSEWTLYFHYAAPLLPLFWIATAESLTKISTWKSSPALIQILSIAILVACIAAQFLLGPAHAMATTLRQAFRSSPARAEKDALLSKIPPEASVLAPLPYLSHLATREKLYSLHFVLKGLKTLSRASYTPPPPTDVVLLDYGDDATFDAFSGYYHPAMKTADGHIVPSSDRLLHSFLSQASWTADARNEFTLLRKTAASNTAPATNESNGVQFADGSTLLGMTRESETLSRGQELIIRMQWRFEEPRECFPWLELSLTRADNQQRFVISKGLCAPEAPAGLHDETWKAALPEGMPVGDYICEAHFYDNAKRAWAEQTGRTSQPTPPLVPPVPLGQIKVVEFQPRP